MFAEIQPLVINYNVIIHVGANNLSRGSPVDQVLTKYQTLVQSIWSTNPKAQVILSGVIPRAQNNFPHAILGTDWLQDYNNRASELNSRLTKIASTHHQLTYIGHSNFVCSGVLQRHQLSTDGLHLSFKGKSSVVDDMEKAILTLRLTQRKYVTPPPTTEYQAIWDSQTTSVT